MVKKNNNIMKFTISQSSLLPAISQAQRIISSKQVLPILEMVKISTHKKSITLEATDLTIGVTINLLAEVLEEGSFVVPIKTFFAQLATLPQQDLEVSIVDQNIEVSSGQTHLLFPSGEVSDFPELPQFKGQSWKIAREVLIKTAQLVLPSTAKDQVRPILSSVLFVQNKEDLEIVATDGVRLSVLKQSNTKLPTQQILLPGRAIAEITKILETSDAEEIELSISEEQQVVETQIGNTKFFSKLVAGEYPPYQKIIPESFQTSIKLDKSELEENVKRSVLIGGREGGYFQLVIRREILEEGEAKKTKSTDLVNREMHGVGITTLLTRNQSGQSVESIIPCRDLEGEPVEIAFSSRYVLDMLRSISDQEVLLSINSPLKPVVFTVDSEPGFRFVIMPFKVKI